MQLCVQYIPRYSRTVAQFTIVQPPQSYSYSSSSVSVFLGAWLRLPLCRMPCPPADPAATPALPLPAPPQDETSGFAQLTVRVPSTQRFAAYDRRGKLVAGSPEQVGLPWAAVRWAGLGWVPAVQ